MLAALVFAGNNAAGYMATGGFLPAYATSPAVGLERTDVLLAVTFAAAVWFAFTFIGRVLADKIGRKRTYMIGFTSQSAHRLPAVLADQHRGAGMLYLALAMFTIGLGLSYGPQAAWYSEIFPASVRFSGVSISYALGAILGGAFAPTIATALVQATGGTAAVSFYLRGWARVPDRGADPAGPRRHRPLRRQPGRTGSRGHHLRQAQRTSLRKGDRLKFTTQHQ